MLHCRERLTRDRQTRGKLRRRARRDPLFCDPAGARRARARDPGAARRRRRAAPRAPRSPRAIRSIAALLPRVQTAVNRAMAARRDARSRTATSSRCCRPSRAAPAPRKIAIRAEPLVVDETVAAVAGPNRGGVVTFTGVVRRAGPPPARRRSGWSTRPTSRWPSRCSPTSPRRSSASGPAREIAIHHRIGALAVGEIAVAITAASAHRAPAFEACRAAIDRLKERAPIWKKEIGASGEAWLGLGRLAARRPDAQPERAACRQRAHADRGQAIGGAGRHHRRGSRAAGGAGAGGAGGADRHAGAGHGRERDGQGAGRARAARAGTEPGGPVRRRQLRRAAARAGGERAVRPRARRVHRRGGAPAPAGSRRRRAARWCSTRSASCRWTCSPSCCACWRPGGCGAWAAPARSPCACASSR